MGARVIDRIVVQTNALYEANRALAELKRGPIRGAEVLLIG
jgi:hypothetical protein